MISYPLDDLYEEVAYLAYHFHWPHAEIMGMEHHDRRYWVEAIDEINKRRNKEDEERIVRLRSGVSEEGYEFDLADFS